MRYSKKEGIQENEAQLLSYMVCMHKPCAYPLREVANGHVPSLFISPIVFSGAMSTSPS